MKPALSATLCSPQADIMDELKLNVREAVQSHFDEAKATFRLVYVRPKGRLLGSAKGEFTVQEDSFPQRG